MARLRQHVIEESRDINMMPMMDVIFQLLLFFILTSTLTKPTQIEVDLPNSTSGTIVSVVENVVITYQSQDGRPRITLDGQEVASLNDLRQILKNRPVQGERPPVEIQIAKTIPYQEVISVMDAVRDAGYLKFSLLTLTRRLIGE